MEPQRDLKTLITDSLAIRNLNQEKLSQLTGIPTHYLQAIENHDLSKLPASPYVRGYLKKIAQALHLNQDELWKMYEQELAVKSSGPLDKLPSNRFAIKPINKKYWLIAVFLLIIATYVGFQMRTFFGDPFLDIAQPHEQTTSSTEPSIILSGRIDSKDKLLINGVETLTDNQGAFETAYNLQPGLNTIEFKVKRLLGKETIINRQVLYQPPAAEDDNNASNSENTNP